MIYQLPLALDWSDMATFENFYPEGNEPMLACLQARKQSAVYLQGPSGVGLSHLLYATCHAVEEEGGVAAYWSFKNPQLSPLMLEGMENLSVICWDDIESVAGNAVWEEALFHCYNRMQTSTAQLLIASHTPLKQVHWRLPDLKSRLMASTVFTVNLLSDAQKIGALQFRAKRRGLALSDEVGAYLLHHCPRDMQALFATLDKLDHFSLAAQRRLTIPFVKTVLGF